MGPAGPTGRLTAEMADPDTANSESMAHPEAAGSGGGPSRNLIAGILALVVVAAVIVVVLITGGSDSEDGGGDAASAGVLPGGCRDVAAAEPKEISLSAPENLEPVGGNAIVETSCGSFTIALDSERAPITVASFENLVNEGVYDGTPFHRVVPGFVIQGGDPAGNGTGGPGYSVEEPPPADLVYSEGIVAMAKTDAEPSGTSGSQFFVVLPADAGLPPDFALVGQVSAGFDVVEAIAALGDETDPSGAPTSPVLIDQITLDPS